MTTCHSRTRTCAAWVALVSVSVPAHAAVFGSLGNFDTVNDTGMPAYGFEIDIEDASFDHTKITSVFGYNRVFSFISPDPGAVVRFGKPVITDVPGYGVKIVYGGTLGGSVFTPANNPAAPFITSGESCWPGANPGWTSNPCDHFGVSTYGNPASIRYSWLVDDGTGQAAKRPVGIPAVSFVPVGLPPVAGAPPPAVLAVVQAPVVEQPNPYANAFWVKLTQTTLAENVDLGDLLIGKQPGAHREIAELNNKPESETEWYELQVGRVDELSKELKPNGDPALVIDLKFYKYQGQFDDEGLVDPLTAEKPRVDANGVAYVLLANGRHDLVYVGQQVGGFNANEIAAAIPEPRTWSMFLAGWALLGVAVRSRRRRETLQAR